MKATSKYNVISENIIIIEIQESVSTLYVWPIIQSSFFKFYEIP